MIKKIVYQKKNGGIYRLSCGEKKKCVHGTTLFELCNLELTEKIVRRAY